MEEPAQIETEADKTIETDDQPLDQEIWVAGEIPEAPDSQLETARFDWPEPELETTKETELLWEDSQRWFGIPVASQYRISNRSLQIMDRLARKFESIRGALPEAHSDVNPRAHVGLICAGTSRYATEESRDQLRQEYGLETSYLRLKAYPFTAHLLDFIRRHERVYVIDQNRDAQLLGLMRLELEPELIAKLRSVRYYGGLPLDARTVTDDIVAQEGR